MRLSFNTTVSRSRPCTAIWPALPNDLIINLERGMEIVVEASSNEGAKLLPAIKSTTFKVLPYKSNKTVEDSLATVARALPSLFHFSLASRSSASGSLRVAWWKRRAARRSPHAAMLPPRPLAEGPGEEL